jgi:uncharacterized protein (TIGR03083 family)
MTVDGLPELIRTERQALIDLLETLTPDEWATQSSCGEWTVQDVAAHLAWMPVISVRRSTLELARSRFRINRMIAEYAVRMAGRGPDAIVEQLRANAAGGAKPIGVPPVAALADAVVHQLDIRRPLGKARSIPPAAFIATADFFATQRWPLTIPIGGNPPKRIAGLRLVAADADWSHGEGPEVGGSSEALVLMLSGRHVGPDELTGPGAEQLYARL